MTRRALQFPDLHLAELHHARGVLQPDLSFLEQAFGVELEIAVPQ